MKKYMKTGQQVVLSTLLATFTLFSCNKQESVEPQVSQQAELPKTSESNVSTAFVFDKNGKQILESEWLEQMAQRNLLKRSKVISGKRRVSVAIVEDYADSHRNGYKRVDWIKKKFSESFTNKTVKSSGHYLDGVSFGTAHFGSGVNASNEMDWEADVNYKFEKVGSVRTVRSPWHEVTSVVVRATNTEERVIDSDKIDLANETITRNSSVTKTKTHGIDLGFTIKASLAKIWEVSTNIKYSFSSATATMEGGSISTQYTPKLLSRLVVPKGKKCRLALMKQTVTGSQRYRVKVWFSGYVGGNYERKVDGHYFWATAARRFFDKAHNKYHEVVQEEAYPTYDYILRDCKKL